MEDDIQAVVTPPAPAPKASSAAKGNKGKGKEKDDGLDFDSLLEKASKGKSGEDESFSSVTMIDLDAPVEIFSTGIPQLDGILGGGLHWGRMTEVFGPNKSGKTELARYIAAAVLELDPDTEVWYFDQEFALNPQILPKYPALQLRNDAGKKRFRPLSAGTLEDFFRLLFKVLRMLGQINEKLVKEGKKRKKILFVLDSVPALKADSTVSNEELEKSSLLPEARIWSEQTSKLRQYLAHVGAHALLINQIRDKPGTPAYVDPESPGGQAIKFYADYRFYLRNSGKFSFSKGRTVPPGKRASGFFSKLTVRKNKTGLPEREMDMIVTYTDALGKKSGVSPEWSLFYALLDAKIIKSAGGKFRLAGLDEGFDRIDWIDMCDEMLKTPGSALSEARQTWVSRQLANDSGSTESEEDDG